MDIEKVKKYCEIDFETDEEGDEYQKKLFFIEVTFGGDKGCLSELIDGIYFGMEGEKFDFGKMLSVVGCDCYWIEKHEYSGEDVVAFDTEEYSSTACLDWVFEDRKSAEEATVKIGYEFFKRGYEYFENEMFRLGAQRRLND